MPHRFVVNLRQAKKLSDVGAKARGLHWLMRQGVPVPEAYALTYQAHAIVEGQSREELALLRHELASILRADQSYAVRSAANLEDGQVASFAGQFTSILDNCGVEQVLESAERIYASATNSGAHAYMDRKGMDRQHLRMSVIIQEMVRPTLSGVAFSKNPITGFDEVIVEAVDGTGSSLVQSGVTPQRWVHKWGEWIASPEDRLDHAAVMKQLVSETKRLSVLYGQPIDLEWIFDGHTIHWLQVRPITRLGQPNVYSNRIAREVLPGIIKPLVWSVNIPVVNGAWTDLFTELIGSNDIDPNALAKPFYHRAYFNMAVIGRVFTALGMPEETLEVMMGLEGGEEEPRFRPGLRTVRHFPRMVRFLIDKLRFSRRVEATLPGIRESYAAFDLDSVGALDDQALVAQVERLNELYRSIAYLNIVTPILAMAYDALLRKQLAHKGVPPEQFDLMAGVEELEAYDPNVHLARLHRAFRNLDQESQQRIRNSDYPTFLRLPGLSSFQEGVDDFINRFGHLSDSGNDLSSVPWRENQQLVLRLIVDFVEQQDSSDKLLYKDMTLRPHERPLFRYAYRMARQFRLYREAVSSTYTYGYGLFRAHFLEIGRRLARRQLVQAPEDVFYLHQDEAIEALSGDTSSGSLVQKVTERRSTIEATRDFALPAIIYGEEPPPVETLDGGADRLIGVATSRGYYKGPAKVIKSVEEFNRLESGDVLIIPYSDVAWTPLFAKAGAVVAESGGILSHSSIVAREYDLPAVVSVDDACRIPDGRLVTVDGIAGHVLLH